MLAGTSFQSQLKTLRQNSNPYRENLIETLQSLDKNERRSLREKTDITGRSLGQSLAGIMRNGFDAEFRTEDMRDGVFRTEHNFDNAFVRRYGDGGGNDYVAFNMEPSQYPSRPLLRDRIIINNEEAFRVVKGNGVKNGSMIFHAGDLIAVVGHEEGTSLQMRSLAGGGCEIFVA